MRHVKTMSIKKQLNKASGVLNSEDVTYIFTEQRRQITEDCLFSNCQFCFVMTFLSFYLLF